MRQFVLLTAKSSDITIRGMIGRLSPALIAALALLFSVSVLRSQEPQGQPLPPLQQPGMNERQLAHSKLYQRYSGIGDLRSIAAKSDGDIEVLSGVGQKIFFPGAPSTRLEDFITGIARHADAVIIVSVNDQKSFLTADGTFIFTDYTVTVEQILKNNAEAQLHLYDSTIVTRPGGTVQVSGRAIKAYDEYLESFEVGKRYLLFLNYISTTGDYKAFDGGGAFWIDGQKTRKLTKDQLPRELETGADLSTLIAYIQATIR